VNEPATLPASPKEIEKAGKKLAQALVSQSISVVVCWDKAEDAVLAHVVARELGVPVCYAYESGGIMGLESKSRSSIGVESQGFPSATRRLFHDRDPGYPGNESGP